MGYAICQYANEEDTENTQIWFTPVPQVCSVDPDAYAHRGHRHFRLCLR